MGEYDRTVDVAQCVETWPAEEAHVGRCHRVATHGDFELHRVKPQVATVRETQIDCGLLAQCLGTRCFELPAGVVRIPGAQSLVR